MLKLLRNAQVYAPAPLGSVDLLVAGERIAWLGNSAPSLGSGLDVATFDLAGRRVIPGFIDGHAHITGGGGESGFASRVPPVALSRFTSAGITGVVGVLGTDDTTRDTRGLVAQARGLTEEGISAWCHTGGYHVPPVTLTGTVRDDIVFIDRILGIGELAISDHRSSQPTVDELLRIAGDAHVAGLITGKAGIVHLHVGDGRRGLELIRRALELSELPARVFNPTHCNRRKALFDEALDLAKAGCTIDVTAFPVADGEDAWPAETALMRYLDAALPAERFTVSSDGGGCLPTFDSNGELVSMDIGQPHALHTALTAACAAGVPLETALPAFTANVARLLRLSAKGRIEAGADADLVVLDDGGAIDGVMARGRWHRFDGQQLTRGMFEENSDS